MECFLILGLEDWFYSKTPHLFFDYGGFVESVISYECYSGNVTLKIKNLTSQLPTRQKQIVTEVCLHCSLKHSCKEYTTSTG